MVAEADRAGLPYAVACVMLMLESSVRGPDGVVRGGHNVYGHDRGACFSDPGIHYVTEENYQQYLKCVRDGGKRNGVGPAQLTYWSLQGKADERGGCWDPTVSTSVGIEHLADQVRRHGARDGFAFYNTGRAYVPSKPPAPPNYAEKAMALLPRWEQVVTRASG